MTAHASKRRTTRAQKWNENMITTEQNNQINRESLAHLKADGILLEGESLALDVDKKIEAGQKLTTVEAGVCTTLLPKTCGTSCCSTVAKRAKHPLLTDLCFLRSTVRKTVLKLVFGCLGVLFGATNAPGINQ
jgi:hypothetical protein